MTNFGAGIPFGYTDPGSEERAEEFKNYPQKTAGRTGGGEIPGLAAPRSPPFPEARALSKPKAPTYVLEDLTTRR